jgi:FKBP-type peptidyl-prolyl cis-trans isomerase FklB
MKKLIAVAIILSIFDGVVIAQKNVKLKTQKEKVSYSIGVTIGKNVKMQGIDLDQKNLLQGIKDGINNSKKLLSDKEIEETLTAFQNEMIANVAEKNRKEGEAFLAVNKQKEGVVTLPSGLQYKIIVNGTGPKPTADQTVECHYRGTLINGTEFDSSIKRGKPAEFELGKVIKGWTEALQLMPVGSKWQLFIPSELAYGNGGAGQIIGPNSTLIFEVELLSIK